MGDGAAGRGRRPAQGEPVLDRAFRILAAFEPGQRSLSLAALSRRAGLPKPTALRLARKLVQWGALERAASGEYVVGLRLLEIASLAPRGTGCGQRPCRISRTCTTRPGSTCCWRSGTGTRPCSSSGCRPGTPAG